MEVAINVVWAQLERHCTDFHATVLYLGKMVMKKGPSMQFVCIVKARSQLVRPKMAFFMGKVECKKYPKPFETP